MVGQSTEPTDEAVRLTQFTVSASTEDEGYLTTQTLGSGRVRTPIMQMPGSIQILNRNIIDDLGALRLIDVAKLVSGVTEGTIPNVVERYMMRGVSGDIRLIDGFTAFDQANTDAVNVERLEVVKGPSSLLFANGPVGGLINQITKAPLAVTRRSLTAQVGTFDSNRLEADFTGPLNASKSLLYRVVGLWQDGDSFWDGVHSKRQLFAPSFTYQISPKSALTIKAEYFANDVGGYNGVPFDAATRRIVNVPAERNLSATTSDNYLKSHRRSIYVQFTSQLTDEIAMRLAVRGQKSISEEFDLIGVVPPTFTTANGNTTFLRRIDAPRYNFGRWSIQNDFVFNFHTGKAVRHNLVSGWDIADNYQSTYRTLGPVNLPIDIYNPVPQPAGSINPAQTTYTLARTDTWKAFALEQMFLFDERLILSGGVVRTHYAVEGRNLATRATTSFLEGNQRTAQGGIVYRPTAQYSLYYTYNENFTPGSITQGVLLPNTIGKQNEVGIKTLVFNDRLSFSTAYYDIQIANATQLTTNASGPLLVSLPNSTTRGWEFDVNFSLKQGWNVIGSWSNNLSRGGNGIQTRGAPRQMGSLWVSYKVRDGHWKGLGGAVGGTYSAERPGNFGDTFRLPGYALLNVAVYYETKSYRIALNVDNALDRFYAAGSLNESRVYLGPGRNLRLSGTYKF
ncbi:MAG: TonB-dependent siderophore receptor [Opitutus sp.]